MYIKKVSNFVKTEKSIISSIKRYINKLGLSSAKLNLNCDEQLILLMQQCLLLSIQPFACCRHFCLLVATFTLVATTYTQLYWANFRYQECPLLHPEREFQSPLLSLGRSRESQLMSQLVCPLFRIMVSLPILDNQKYWNIVFPQPRQNQEINNQ